MARKRKVRVEILTKVFSSGYYAERGLDCLERRGFDRKDFRIKLDFPQPGDASLHARTFEADRMAWEEAPDCLEDPLDEPLPPMEGRMKRTHRLVGKPRHRMGQITAGDVTAAHARALRTCRLEVGEDCQAACRAGVSASERETKAVLRRHGLGRIRKRAGR